MPSLSFVFIQSILVTASNKKQEYYLLRKRENHAQRKPCNANRATPICAYSCNHFGSTHKTFRYLCNDGLYAIMACTRAAAAIVKTKSTIVNEKTIVILSEERFCSSRKEQGFCYAQQTPNSSPKKCNISFPKKAFYASIEMSSPYSAQCVRKVNHLSKAEPKSQESEIGILKKRTGYS